MAGTHGRQRFHGLGELFAEPGVGRLPEDMTVGGRGGEEDTLVAQGRQIARSRHVSSESLINSLLRERLTEAV